MKGKKKFNGKGKPPRFNKNYKGGNRGEERANQNDSVPQRENDARLSSLNDFSWYNANPALIQASASIPFPYRPGMAMDLIKSTDSAARIANYHIPGIAVLEWTPSIGNSFTATDPASVAAKEIYAKVREKFSGSLDADPPDFIIYLLALDSIYSAVGAAKRIFRIISTYSPNNFYLPEKLLIALGIDDNDIQNWVTNKMSLYQYINEIIGMVQKFRCPAVMDIFNRHYWMNDNIYLDAPTANAQMYAFCQSRYFKYTLINTPAGVPAGGLSLVNIDMREPKSWYEGVRGLIDALAGSEDAYTISGYLMRAFEGEPIFGVDPVTLTDVFQPVYVEEVLSQIENSHTIDFGMRLDDFTISQDPSTNAVLCQVTAGADFGTGKYANEASAASIAGLSLNPVLSLRTDMPTAAEVTIASRLCAVTTVPQVDESGTRVSSVIWAGTEVPEIWRFYTNEHDLDDGITFRGRKVYSGSFYIRTTQDESDEWNAGVMPLVTCFNWHPICVLVQTVVNGDSWDFYPYVLGDLHNLTTLSQGDLTNLHRVCLFSEFNSFRIQ
nr:putative capsid [Marmot picobirnavirus]